MKSKVTVSSRAISSHSTRGAPVMALEHVVNLNEEVPSLGASQCWVVRDYPKKSCADPMWETTQWLQE